MKGKLLRKLDLGNPETSEKLHELLEEDLPVKREREQPESRRRRLEDAISELRKCGV